MVALMVNGRMHNLDIDPDMPLLWALRDALGLTGSKYGCGIAQCGACVVHLDGEPVPACQTPVAAAEGAQIVTIEGLSGPVADALRTAWTQLDVPQCGYCQSGQVMAAAALLARNRKPSGADIDEALANHLCRCATYQRIRAGVQAAATMLG